MKNSFPYFYFALIVILPISCKKDKNDIILNSDAGFYRLDLNTMSFTSISPKTSANTAITSLVTQPLSNGQYSNRIYAVVCSLDGLTLTANLVYYE
jgi:hypothetical protein